MVKPESPARDIADTMSTGDDASRSLEQLDSRRLVVRVGDQHMPLFGERPILDSLGSPWNGLILEKHHHRGCEIPVHDHDGLCLHLQTGGQVEMEWFCSGKSGMHRSTPGSMMLLPAGTRDSVILISRH